MFGMLAGTENLSVASTVEFDSLEQKETYESAACAPPRDSDFNILKNSTIFIAESQEI